MPNEDAALHQRFKLLFQAHPWHGVSPGEDAPETINAYIEIVPTDVVKYELDKISGHLHVDRLQRFYRCARRSMASYRKLSAVRRLPNCVDDTLD